MRDKLIPLIEKKNMKVFHSVWGNQWEGHHVKVKGMGGGVCITDCCLHFIVPAKHGHQADWQFVEAMREKFRQDVQKTEDNYITNVGCINKELYKECKYCKMPQVEGQMSKGGVNAYITVGILFLLVIGTCAYLFRSCGKPKKVETKTTNTTSTSTATIADGKIKLPDGTELSGKGLTYTGKVEIREVEKIVERRVEPEYMINLLYFPQDYRLNAIVGKRLIGNIYVLGTIGSRLDRIDLNYGFGVGVMF